MDNETAKQRHTLGPLEVRPDATSKAIFVYGPDGNAVASVRRRWRGGEEQLAYARLFVAAPELLEACQIAAGYFTSLPQHPDRGHDIANDLAVLKAAIAKAEGTAEMKG
ncbi:hypothetical protein LCGC14_0811390 [marine sediment metagenome]|uniref:Uncharacterized protein n=1 Tax=marine sediment metagenome TaxID=412755 RepID=A0A0F9STZ0_9ZZZZ